MKVVHFVWWYNSLRTGSKYVVMHIGMVNELQIHYNLIRWSILLKLTYCKCQWARGHMKGVNFVEFLGVEASTSKTQFEWGKYRYRYPYRKKIANIEKISCRMKKLVSPIPNDQRNSNNQLRGGQPLLFSHSRLKSFSTFFPPSTLCLFMLFSCT